MFERDIHFRPEGYRLMAEAVTRFFSESDLLSVIPHHRGPQARSLRNRE